jgi:hypothetical protein
VHTVAIYRLLYGSDFLGESLASIYPAVDRILCYVTRDMFGGRRVVKYFGRDVYLPHDIDGVTDAIAAWKASNDPAGKVEIIRNPWGSRLIGQLSNIVNEHVIPRLQPTHVMLVEPDEVWRPDVLNRLMTAAASGDADEYMAAPPHLFWRSFRYVSARSNPYCVLRAIKGRRAIEPTGHALASAKGGLVRHADPSIRVHNFGFAGSERTTFWKHLTSLSFSRDARLDDPPREEWFEDVWRAWNWHTNRRQDLCPSIGHEHAFAPAIEYPFDELPESIKTRAHQNPLPEWVAMDQHRSAHGAAA